MSGGGFDFRFGSLSAPRHRTSSPAGIEGKAALRQEILDHRNLAGSFHRKQSFKLLEKPCREGRESATSGRWRSVSSLTDGP